MDEPWRLPAEVMCRVQHEKTWSSGQRACILRPCQGQNGNPSYYCGQWRIHLLRHRPVQACVARTWRLSSVRVLRLPAEPGHGGFFPGAVPTKNDQTNPISRNPNEIKHRLPIDQPRRRGGQRPILPARGKSRAGAKNGDCHPIFVRRRALFLIKMDCENRWLYPFFMRTHFYHGLLAAAVVVGGEVAREASQGAADRISLR